MAVVVADNAPVIVVDGVVVVVIITISTNETRGSRGRSTIESRGPR